MDKIMVWDNAVNGKPEDPYSRYTILDKIENHVYFVSEENGRVRFDCHLIGCINMEWMDENNKRIEFEELPENIQKAWRGNERKSI